MHPSVVADAGGLLVLAGLLEGVGHEVDEILALDATSMLLAEYLALRHAGVPDRARREFGLVARTVREWFPIRTIALDAALAAGAPQDLDGQAALHLAESLGAPLVTKNRGLRSRNVAVLYS